MNAGGRRRSLLLRTAAVAAGVVIVDQATKSLALARLSDEGVDVFWTLRLRLAFNSGMAFSQGGGFTGAITIVGLVLVVVLVLVARRAERPVVAVALGLLLGGACGNLFDRLFRSHGGAVVDFIDFQWWPVFNVADVGVTCGAALLVLTSLREPAPTAAR